MKKLFMVIPLVFMLCFTFSCQDKEAMAELEKYKAQAAVEEQNKAVLVKWFESINTGDFKALKELMAPEYLLYGPSRTTETQSSDEYIEQIKAVRSAFPDFKWKILELIPVGDRVIMRYQGNGTHKGEWAGISATGNQVEYGGTAIFRFKDGKVVEEMADADGLGIMLQIGMELKPKEGE